MEPASIAIFGAAGCPARYFVSGWSYDLLNGMPQSGLITLEKTGALRFSNSISEGALPC
ncbi:MAG: hypothetical protein ACYC9I_12215 [Desulfuromonadales bacterium]